MLMGHTNYHKHYLPWVWFRMTCKFCGLAKPRLNLRRTAKISRLYLNQGRYWFFELMAAEHQDLVAQEL